MQEEKVFSNPYDADKARREGTKLTQVSVPIYLDEVNFFRLIRPALGTLTAIAGTLWRKLYEECNDRNLTDYSNSTEFEQFVTHCHIISHEEWLVLQRHRGGRVQDRTPGRAGSETGARDDRGGMPPAGDGNATNAAVVPDVQSRNRASGRGQRKNG